MKLTAYFKDNNMYNLTTDNQLIKPKANKKWRPDKIHHTEKASIEAIKNALENRRVKEQ